MCVFIFSVTENLKNININLLQEDEVKKILCYQNKFDRDKRVLSRIFVESLKLNEAWKFNVSYSADFVSVVVSDKHMVGVDLEFVSDSTDRLTAADVFMHPKELVLFRSLKEQEKKILFFYTLWVCKEAVLKALGTGLMIPPHTVCLWDTQPFKDGWVSLDGEKIRYFILKSGLGCAWCVAAH